MADKIKMFMERYKDSSIDPEDLKSMLVHVYNDGFCNGTNVNNILKNGRGYMFEDFLQDKHAEDYHGTDDNMPEDFEDWLMNLDIQELVDYGNELAKQLSNPTK